MNRVAPGNLVWRFVLLLAFQAVAFLTYFGARNLDWSFDDEFYLESARLVANGELSIWSADKAWWQGLGGGEAERPTVHLYFYVAHFLLGADPASYHMANVAFHGLIAFLLSMVTFGWLRRRPVAIAAGLVFLVSLSHFRAFLWVSGVSILLAAMFGLLAIVVLQWWRGRLSLVISSLLFLLAVLAHESAAVFLFPIAVLIQDRGKLLRGLWPFVLIVAILVVLSAFVYQTPLTQETGDPADHGAVTGPVSDDFLFGSHVISNIPKMVFRLFVEAPLGDRWSLLVQDLANGARIGLLLQISIGLAILLALAVASRRSAKYRLLGVSLLLGVSPYLFWVGAAESWRYRYIPSLAACMIVAVFLFGEAKERAHAARSRANVVRFAAVALLCLVSISGRGYALAVQHSFSGLYLYRTGEHTRSLAQYRFARAQGGGHASSYRWLSGEAECRLAAGDGRGAYDILSNLIRERWALPSVYPMFLQSFAAAQGKRYEDASAQSDLAPSVRESAFRTMQAGELEEAESLLILYLHYRPGDSGAIRMLIDIYRGQGRGSYADELERRLNEALGGGSARK